LQCVFTKTVSNKLLYFHRSHAPAWECIWGTLLRPGSPPWESTAKRAISPPVSDAGASGDFRSHAGAWERWQRRDPCKASLQAFAERSRSGRSGRSHPSINPRQEWQWVVHKNARQSDQKWVLVLKRGKSSKMACAVDSGDSEVRSLSTARCGSWPLRREWSEATL
jgi:hypothetical protein